MEIQPPPLRARDLLALWRPGIWLGLLALLLPLTARAQATDLSQSFQVERFQPEPGRNDVLGVESAQVAGHLSYNAGLFISYAGLPLRVVSVDDPTYQRALLKGQSTLSLVGSVGLLDRFEIGAVVPATIIQFSQDAGMVDPKLASGAPVAGMDDIRLMGKVALLDQEGFGLAIAVPVTLPTGRKGAYIGQQGATVGPRLIGELRGPGGLRGMANVGIVVRQTQQLLNLYVGSAVAYGFGGTIDLLPNQGVALLATITGEVGLVHPDVFNSPAELDVAVRWTGVSGLGFTVGGGTGLDRGYGAPRFRVLAGLQYTPPEKRAPRPLAIASSEVHVAAGSGAIIKVPPEGRTKEPLHVTGVEAQPASGTVEVVDGGTLKYTPRPGFAGRDEFSYRAAGADPGRAGTGTVVVRVDPPVANAPDEVHVFADSTATIPAPSEGGGKKEPLHVKEVSTPNSGTVEVAADGTLRYSPKPGFIGRDEFSYRAVGSDPARPRSGTVVVIVEPRPKSGIIIKDNRLSLDERVYFATDKANVLPKSLPILDKVAEFMTEHPTLRIKVEAYTDNVAPAAYNLRLSNQRAEWVREYLIKKGLDPRRLESEGYGMTKPIDSNLTEEGRARNRRVEFRIISGLQ